ncbi:hypothetical protein LOD99_14523 [Oopsacas minuta]|uniref:26S proteasome complex subunit SEM1 n=1 Tax=Oopsacas minuta TaxID=111878 RepID=A0AAV7KFF2_9METZ|nr:hypothetical protein LOD99_14523 [Oopsacas minuta]
MSKTKDNQSAKENSQNLDSDAGEVQPSKISRLASSRFLDISLLDEEDKFEEFSEENWHDNCNEVSPLLSEKSIENSNIRFWEEDWTDLGIDSKFSQIYQQVALDAV